MLLLLLFIYFLIYSSSASSIVVMLGSGCALIIIGRSYDLVLSSSCACEVLLLLIKFLLLALLALVKEINYCLLSMTMKMRLLKVVQFFATMDQGVAIIFILYLKLF